MTGTSITFGQTAPHTGPAGEYGQSELGVKAYFDMVNAQGGINGRKLKLISLDDQYTPSVALQDTKQLLFKDNVFAEVAVNGSATTNADLTVLIPNNVPLVGPQTGDTFLQPFKKSVYNVWPSYKVEGKTMGDFAAKNLHLNKIVVLYQNDPFGQALLAGVEASAAKPKIAKQISYDPTQTDFSSDALQAKNANGDGVLFLALPGSTNSMENAMAAINYHPKEIMSQVSAIPNSSFSAAPKEFPGAYIGAFVPPLDPPATPAAKTFVNAMKKYEPGKAVTVFSGWGWIEAQSAVAGLKNVHGALTRESYEAGLDKVSNVETMGGSITYGSNDHIGLTCESMVQAENGKFVPVKSGPTCK
ncbi:MAG: ABC transporter substrate-binding protein [Marmoricola sp.]